MNEALRTLQDHIVSEDQAVQLRIEVMDGPGAGGASHWYEISDKRGCLAKILFQNGAIKEAGVNGVTQEALLAIVIDRLRSFQGGPYACDDNELALKYCVEALHALQRRTLERLKRGVEGTTRV